MSALACEGCPLQKICREKTKFDKALRKFDLIAGFLILDMDRAADAYVNIVSREEFERPEILEDPVTAASNTSLRSFHEIERNGRDRRQRRLAENIAYQDGKIKPWDDIARLAQETCSGPVEQKRMKIFGEQVIKCSSPLISLLAQENLEYIYDPCKAERRAAKMARKSKRLGLMLNDDAAAEADVARVENRGLAGS